MSDPLDTMQAAVHRLSAAGPSDTTGLDDAIAQGLIRPDTIVAVLGKTEGNGCVNDFTRSFATASFRACLARHLGVSAAEIDARVALGVAMALGEVADEAVQDERVCRKGVGHWRRSSRCVPDCMVGWERE